MADRIEFSVSATPIETVTSEDGTSTHDVIAGEIRTTVGATGSCAVTDYQGTDAHQGFGGSAGPGVKTYREADDGNDTTDISADNNSRFVFIKNTGFLYSSATALGAALNASVKVMSGTTCISVLATGEAIILKDVNGGIDCGGIHVRTVLNNGSNGTPGHMAVEFLIID
jgi:hypothetical protein